jgi:hypothetical protein
MEEINYDDEVEVVGVRYGTPYTDMEGNDDDEFEMEAEGSWQERPDAEMEGIDDGVEAEGSWQAASDAEMEQIDDAQVETEDTQEAAPDAEAPDRLGSESFSPRRGTRVASREKYVDALIALSPRKSECTDPTYG